MKERYFLLTKDGFIDGVVNEKPKDGILYTTIDYALQLKEPINPKFDFKTETWSNTEVTI